MVSAESVQHVHNDDKDIPDTKLGDGSTRKGRVSSGDWIMNPKGGNVYINGERLKPPKGKWAVSLPSDDNKMRRKWYAVRDTGRVRARNLVLPEGRGELVEGGQDTTLRWRPKFRYAHGYPGQDGPHWLGGYSDIRDPPKQGADSISGKGLPGVQVYSWSLDKDLASRDPAQAQKIDHAGSSLWQDLDKIGQALASFVWPPLAKESPTQLQYNRVDGKNFGNGLPNPVGEIMEGPRPVSLLQGLPLSSLDGPVTSSGAGADSGRNGRKDNANVTQEGDSISSFYRWVEDDLLSVRHHKGRPFPGHGPGVARLASALQVTGIAKAALAHYYTAGDSRGSKRQEAPVSGTDTATPPAAAPVISDAHGDSHASLHGTPKRSFAKLVKEYETKLRAEEWSASRALKKGKRLRQNLENLKAAPEATYWEKVNEGEQAEAVEDDKTAKGETGEIAGANGAAPVVMKYAPLDHHILRHPRPTKDKVTFAETLPPQRGEAMFNAAEPGWPEPVAGPAEEGIGHTDPFFSMGRGQPFEATAPTYGIPAWRPTGAFDPQKMASWMRGRGTQHPQGRFLGAGEVGRAFRVVEKGSSLSPKAPGPTPMTPYQRNQAGLREMEGDEGASGATRRQTLRLQQHSALAGFQLGGVGEMEHSRRAWARGERGRRSASRRERSRHSPRHKALPSSFYEKPTATWASRKVHEDWLGLSTDMDPSNLIDSHARQPSAQQTNAKEMEAKAKKMEAEAKEMEAKGRGSRVRKGLSPKAFPRGFHRQVAAEERRLEMGGGNGGGAPFHHVPGARTTGDLDEFDKVIFGGTSMGGDSEGQGAGVAGGSAASARHRHGLPGIHLW